MGGGPWACTLGASWAWIRCYQEGQAQGQREDGQMGA